MFIKLKKIINQRIARLGNKEKIDLGFITKSWEEYLLTLIEEQKANPVIIAEINSSSPKRLENGTLTIEVNNQALSSELSLIGFDIMEKINQSLGRRVVKRLFFRIRRSRND